MAPDSLAVELVAVGAAIAAAVCLAFLWNIARGWRGALVRGATIVTCLVSTAAVGLVWVNRQIDTYTSWSDLLGSSATAPATPSATPAPPATQGPTPGATHGATGGRIISFTVAGRASGLTMPVYAYLPAAYDLDRTTHFPVVEALHGYVGSPLFWQRKLNVVAVLDEEIAAGRMAPTVVIFPYQTPTPLLDTECTNLVNGPQAETFLTVDVPADVRTRLRIRADRNGWGLIGYSTGAYCATDLLLRHPAQYAAAASLSGYPAPGIAVGDGTEHTLYDDAWRLRHLPIPAGALYLACARSDAGALRGTLTLARLARSPLSVTTAYVNGGGHNGQTWIAMEAPAFDWLSTWLGRPTSTP
jgi:enterochelin esterase-like enzyme